MIGFVTLGHHFSFTDFLALVDIRALSRWFFLASHFFYTLGVFVRPYSIQLKQYTSLTSHDTAG